MNNTKTINKTISANISRECKNTRNAFHVLMAHATRAGKTRIFTTINTPIINKIKTTIHESELLEFPFPIEVYHTDHDLSVDKVSSVKVPSRFTVLWAAVKEVLNKSKGERFFEMEHKKMSELSGLARIFPRKALNFWNARREKKRTELYRRLVDADLSLKGLLEMKRIRPESDFLERWVKIQAKLRAYYFHKYERASRKIVKEVL